MTSPASADRTAADWIADLTRTYPDFPTPGILFRDLTPVFADGAAFASIIATMTRHVGPDITAIAGVEARGFLLAAAIAQNAGCGVIAVRKAGKLPGDVISESYALEYGSAELELHRDVLPAGSRVVLVDDLLATGGTLAAATRLLERAGCLVEDIAVVIELGALEGRSRLTGQKITSIVRL